MIGGARRWAAALAGAVASMAPIRSADAESHRIAVVNPDAPLASALEVALLPWDVAILQVTLEGPGPTMPFAVDRARAIARQAEAEVVVWVSESDDQYALWIYDAASDHARARALAEAPPFSPTTAAAVALAVKVLLESTAVAPPAPLAAVAPATVWTFGADVGGALRLGALHLAAPVEARGALSASVWPVALRPWRFAVKIEGGNGLTARSPELAYGTVSDTEVALAAAFAIRLSGVVSLLPTLGGGVHFFGFNGAPAAAQQLTPPARLRVEGAIEPSLAADLALLGARLRLGLRLGAVILPLSPRFLVGAATALDIGPASLEGALHAAVAWP